MINKIAILGAESTGKTDLCLSLTKHYNASYVPEYARAFFEQKQSTSYSQEDIHEIGLKQLLLEGEKAHHVRNKKGQMLFLDTEIIMIKVWLMFCRFEIPAWIDVAIEHSDYSLYLLTENDIAWQNDPLRENENNREELKKMYLDELKYFKKKYQIVSGLGEERTKNAILIIDQIIKK